MNNLDATYKQIEVNFDSDLVSCKNQSLLVAVRSAYLGKKGRLSELSKNLKNLNEDQRKMYGQKINFLKNKITSALDHLEKKFASINTRDNQLENSLPGIKPEIGHLHVITQAIREIVNVFKPLGFNRVRYPEIDWEYYAFEALNIPSTHPARDEWETFFVDHASDEKYGRMVITPHTSSGQVREMLKGELPIRMLNISRCGRRQEDLRHLPTFFQFEGLVIDKNISIKHLVGVVEYFVKHFFSHNREIRLRPYNFRFTEPSFEIDINCDLCSGQGCKFCKGGWVELGGAGMVHPNVLKAGNIDSNQYTGFAFGWGVERTYMMKAGIKIDDIRILFKNDIRFLDQF